MSETGIIQPKSEYSRKVDAALARLDNDKLIPGNFSMDPNLDRIPLYQIYIFNISRKEFDIRRPPMFRHVVFKACPKGQKYLHVGTLNDIVNERWVAAESGQIMSRGERGERVAMDLINPSNLGIDQNAIVNDELTNQLYGSDNLGQQGLFFSRNENPTDEEIAPVRARMEKYYRAKIQEADILSQDERKRIEIGPEHHLAGDYFKHRAKWHTIAEVPETCSNCGEEIRAGISYHTNANGRMCVLDWKAAYESGAIKKDEIPEGKRWWKEEAAKK